MARRRRISLARRLAALRPDIDDPVAAIRRGMVRVRGRVVSNPASLIDPNDSVVIREAPALRGSEKLNAALTEFRVDVGGRVALDVGAAAGGFTAVLLDHGARRVYAVDAGHGQLLGSLRQDPRVVVLERTNVGSLDRRLVPESIDVLTVDLSYLSIADALPQLSGLAFARGADLIALVKPMFELGLRGPSDAASEVRRAGRRARAAALAAGWQVRRVIDSPVLGARGAKELLMHACKP